MGNSSEHSDPSLLRRHSEPKTAPNQAGRGGFPTDGRVSLDPGTRFLAGVNGSTVLLGGSPLRLLTLTGKSAVVVQALAEGASASEAASAAGTSVKSTVGLVDRLLDAQLVHPLWRSTSITEIQEIPLSTVTLVIPVKDREVQLRRLLMSVHREMSEGLSVVVVDDGSTDASGNVAREFGATVNGCRSRTL